MFNKDQLQNSIIRNAVQIYYYSQIHEYIERNQLKNTTVIYDDTEYFEYDYSFMIGSISDLQGICLDNCEFYIEHIVDIVPKHKCYVKFKSQPEFVLWRLKHDY